MKQRQKKEEKKKIKATRTQTIDVIANKSAWHGTKNHVFFH